MDPESLENILNKFLTNSTKTEIKVFFTLKQRVNATSVMMPPLMQVIWTHTEEKPNQCSRCSYASSNSGGLRTHLMLQTGEKPKNATSATMNHLQQVIREHVWRDTLERDNTNASIVTLHHLDWYIWVHIWRDTSNATIMTMHHRAQRLWEDKGIETLPKKITNATCESHTTGYLRSHMKKPLGEK